MKTFFFLLLLSFNVLASGELPTRNKCLDPDIEGDMVLIKEVQRALTVRIFRRMIDDGKLKPSGMNKEELWFDASDQADEYLGDNFICPTLPDQDEI